MEFDPELMIPDETLSISQGAIMAMGWVSASDESSFSGALLKALADEYGFSLDIVVEACSRTVLSTQKNRLQYAEGILKSWHDRNVSTKEDIVKLDKDHAVESIDNSKSSKKSSGKSSLYLQFQQNTYDFDALEKELLKN
jgi:DnaD/phage-associated family protein